MDWGFFLKMCGSEEADRSGWWVSRDLPRFSKDRASWRCCSEGNSTIIHQQAWDGNHGVGRRGVNARAYARKQLLSTNPTASKKIWLLKRSVSTARIFFLFFFLAFLISSMFYTTLYTTHFKLNLAFLILHTQCICALGCVWVSPSGEAQRQKNREQNKGEELVQHWLPLQQQKYSVSSCPSGFVFHPCHWKSHYVGDYVHNWLSRWMTESAVLQHHQIKIDR